MKSRIIILCLALMLVLASSPCFADSVVIMPDEVSGYIQGPSQINTNTGTNTNDNTDTNNNTNNNTNNGTNSNTNTNSLNVSGSPLQASSSNSSNTASQNTTLLNQTLNYSAPENIPNNTFFPLSVPLIQGGRVGDITEQLPNFAGIKKLRLPGIIQNGNNGNNGGYDPGDIINPDKIESFSGCWVWRITLENIWQKVVRCIRKQQERGWDPAKIRYRVYAKDRSTSAGISLGGNGGTSRTNDSGTGGQVSGGAVLGYSQSVSDPYYIVMVCEIIEESPKPPVPQQPLDSDRDGVPDYLDKCPNTPLGVKVDQVGCPFEVLKAPEKAGAVMLEKGRVTLDVEFDFNKDIVKPRYMPQIKDVAQVMADYPDLKVMIEGHTDNIGSARYNNALSLRRANAVKAKIIGLGIAPSRLRAKGYGFSKPIADNKTSQGRQQNRRVEAVIE